jgi:glycosyltransferase involved in cell wall biosynthesis
MRHDNLQVAICHFHLHTGGVTRVIEHCLQALAGEAVKIIILSGEEPTIALPESVRYQVLPGFGYEETRRAQDGPELARELQAAARELFGGDPDLWHFHNHSLGKNLAAPAAIQTLARNGQRVLLQIHDFAEDGRPALYQRMLRGPGGSDGGQLASLLYPVAQHIHYAVLNGRDQQLLSHAGIPDDTLHLLPNAVWLPPGRAATTAPPSHPKQRLWLYPTRAIRRKNLGELLFWSALAPPDNLFATTQAPLNPAERPVYQHWKSLADELALPLAFELGVSYAGDFAHLLQSAHSLVSTSISEGFGLAFLEPWLIERPLVGRNLAEISADFSALGIDLGTLYERLPVPLPWLDAAQLAQRIDAGLQRSFAAYGRKPDDNDRERAWNAFVHNGEVDFGRLDEPLQEIIVRRLAHSQEAAAELSVEPLAAPVSADLIQRNRAAIEAQLNLKQYAQRLLETYNDLVNSPVSPLSHADGAALLDAFLAPERLFLLKT